MRRLPTGYVAAMLLLTVATFALPQHHLLLWGLLGWGASAAVVVGVARNRPARRSPWLLIALALAAFVTGDVAYDVLTRFLGYRDPFPSVADAFYLATYPLLAFGLLGLVRVRRRERRMGPLFDALIVTASFAPPWIFVIAPYIHAADMTLFQKLVSIAYPCGDIAVLCMLARLVLADGLRNWSVRLLSLGAVGLLVADVFYGSIQLNGHWHVGGPTDVGWVLFYVCWGGAALHPSMRELTGTQPHEDKRLSATTLVVLCGATLVAPALLVWRAAKGDASGDVGLLSAASAVVFLLVMARLTGLARAQAAMIDRERALREIGEGLVAASELETVDLEAAGAVESLVGAPFVACVVAVPEGRFQRAVAARPRALTGALFDLGGTGGDPSVLLPERADGGPSPGTARATEWNTFSFGGVNMIERRVMIGSAGPLPLGWGDVGEALAAQLTLAADRVQLAEALHQRKSEAKFRTLIRNASDVIMVVQTGGELRSETPSIEAVLGYDVEAVGALRLAALVHPDDGAQASASIKALQDGSLAGPLRTEWRVRHSDGRWLTMEVVGTNHSEDADVGGAVLTMRDVSDRKVLEQELRHQAFHDSLTNLANRVLFNDRVDHALSRQLRNGTDVSVLLLDIDDFKVINDTLGHPAGDEVLVQFADRLLGCLRSQDSAARFGGDEFAVCMELEAEASPADIAAAASRILEAMATPFEIAGTEVRAQVSIGISVAEAATDGSTDMLREADVALYAAKRSGKGSFHFFEERLQEAAPSQLEQRRELEPAAPTEATPAATSPSTTVLAEQVRRDPRWADLERLRSSHRMMDAVIEEVRGRMIRIGDRWLSDFASCNYLGFDLDEEIIDSVDGALRRWGTHPSWSRLLGNPRPYCDIEEQLTELLGAPDTLVLPTITHIHSSVIPALAAQGWVLVDSRAHKTIYDGAAIAAGQGAVLRRFRTDDGRDVDDLERRLKEVPAGVSRLVCMDGVNSMTGNVTDLAAFARVTRAHDALLYVDDAHGFGLIGERGPDEATPYGMGGNSIVRHAGETYDDVVLVGGFSKAYSSLLAFVALPTWLKNHLKVAAAPYLYSGPSPTASLATVLAGLQVNATRGDSIRADLHRKSARVLDTAKALGLATPNRSGLPIIELPLRHAAELDRVGELLFQHGIYVTLAAYPLVSRRDVGVRVQVTAANTDEQVEQLCEVLGELAERFELEQTPASAVT